MPQICIFTAGNPEARQHLRNCLRNPIEEVIFDETVEDDHEDLKTIRIDSNGLIVRSDVISG